MSLCSNHPAAVLTAMYFRLRGMSAVVVGMADHGMHTVREYVVIPELVDTAHLCEALLRQQDS